MIAPVPRLLLALLAPLALGACFHDSDDPAPGDGPPIEPDLALQRVYPGLGFSRPVLAMQAPEDPSRWYVVEKAGRIWRFDAADPATNASMPVLDISAAVDDRGEGGLLGMAFHPRFATNGSVFLSYTASGAGGFESRLSRLTSPDGGDSLDPASETVILVIPQPALNHNGGHIAFGFDGYLYLGLGDGGGANDPPANAQDPGNLLGSILRLDVDASMAYAIPPDNPFAAGGGRPEIWAYGLRNPWRWSFDRSDGTSLWAGDVGQGRIEEVDLIVAGANYGWPCFEGSLPLRPDDAKCPPAGRLTGPVTEYGRDEGQSITGGYVYRGSSIPALAGAYVFGDFVSGSVWGLFPTGSGRERRLITRTGLGISSFAQDARGEIYVLDYFGGGMYRLVAAGPRGAD